MRKVHYRVVLDVFIHENEDVNVSEALLNDFRPEVNGDGDSFDVIDVNVESVELADRPTQEELVETSEEELSNSQKRR